jgi:hypothetical protein
MSAQVPDKLPEEFAPTGPKLSRFPLLPAPPVRPHLFPDEARFALRLAALAGGTEFVAWSWLSAVGRRREVLLLAALRLLKPIWAWLGTRVPRPAVAFGLLFTAMIGVVASVLTVRELLVFGVAGAGVAAVGDLCATSIADRVTVERRAAAHAWLDMGQGLGGMLGLALGAAYGWVALILSPVALLAGAIAIPDLRDRGMPRSRWPRAVYASVLAAPLTAQLVLAAFATGLVAGPGSALFRLGSPIVSLPMPRWGALIAPVLGMALAARIEPRLGNAMVLPRLCVVVAVLGEIFWAPLQGLAMGAMFAGVPAAVARGAGELERPIASSLAWSALAAGAALGAVL